MTEMAEIIYALVKTRRHVSFAELDQMVPGFKKEPDGKPTCLVFSELPQLVIWVGLSEEALNALDELWKSKKVFLNQCSWMVYMVDGRMLNLPIPKRKPRKGLKKDYWLPCVLDTEPMKRGRSHAA
jgi:hypothetical protein